MTKTKRKLNSKFKLLLLGISIILIIISVFVGINQYEKFQLTEIGYSKKTISKIDKLKLRDILIEKGEFSDSLQIALNQDNVYVDYLDLYFIKDENNNYIIVNQDLITLYSKLLAKSYSKESLSFLLAKLNFREMLPLLIYNDNIALEQYIDDVISNRDPNSNQFVLDNVYITSYVDYKAVATDMNELLLVNKYYKLPDGYAPVNLTAVAPNCRLNEMMLEATTATAFESMCKDMKEAGLSIASEQAYHTHDVQEALYNSIIKKEGEWRGNRLVAKAGFSEHETGYAVDIVSLSNMDVSFEKTEEFKWLQSNAHKYGFIMRYPKGYTELTGMQYKPWHYRYVGVETAQKVYESGLTYEEYYHLYLVDNK